MHRNIRILIEALDESGIRYATVPGFEDAIEVAGRYFVRSNTPFNDEGVSAICRDKAAVHALLSGTVPMPMTRSFFDPKGARPELAIEPSLDGIVSRCALDFLYPRVVKMNRGESGHNVFIVQDDMEMKSALRSIFDAGSKRYDYIALVQEYIEPKRELRAIVAAGGFEFAYDKGMKEIASAETSAKLSALSQTVLSRIPLTWGAIDFIESFDGGLYLLEINTRPGLSGADAPKRDSCMKEAYRKATRGLLHIKDEKNRTQGDPSFARLSDGGSVMGVLDRIR